MSVKLPTPETQKWSIPNKSDKFGNIFFVKNCNFDEKGYVKLSPRTISVVNDVDTSFVGAPVGFGLQGAGSWQVASGDQNAKLTLDKTSSSITEDTGSNNPDLTVKTSGVWFQGLWVATTATDIVSRPATGGASQAWTVEGNNVLSSGYQHILHEFDSRQTLCVTDNNLIRQYDITGGSGSWSADTTLTISADYEAVGLAYNKSTMGIITANSSDNDRQDKEAKFYTWNGTTTGATQGYGVGSRSCVAICPYKSSFAILTGKGELLYFNGGGFTKLAQLPFVNEDVWAGVDDSFAHANNMFADRDKIFINLGLELKPFNRKEEVIFDSSPSGIWCYDPDVGLYHRYSPSASKFYSHTVTAGNIDVSTDTFTTAGTIPPTGNLVRLTSDSSNLTSAGNGLDLNADYYVIKLSATTFKLAATKEKAIENIPVDLNDSLSPAGPIYFKMYDLIDYGNSRYAGDDAYAIAPIAEQNILYKDLIIGARVIDESNVDERSIMVCDPFLENRGYLVTPKIRPRAITDKIQRLSVKFRPLGTDEKILIKFRTKDVRGLPVSSPGTSEIGTWLSNDLFTTTADLSEAKTYLDGGNDLEVEFVAGAGGGQMVQIDSINTNDNATYSVQLKEVVLGAEATRKSHFIINNWQVLKTIDSNSNDKPYEFVELRNVSKWAQWKIEMRGNNVTLEEIIINSDVHNRT